MRLTKLSSARFSCISFLQENLKALWTDIKISTSLYNQGGKDPELDTVYSSHRVGFLKSIPESTPILSQGKGKEF
jgi:hypothetical protein